MRKTYYNFVPKAGNFVTLQGSDSRWKIGAFHLMEIFDLNYRKFSVTNGTAFLEFLEKRTNLAIQDLPKFRELPIITV